MLSRLGGVHEASKLSGDGQRRTRRVSDYSTLLEAEALTGAIDEAAMDVRYQEGGWSYVGVDSLLGIPVFQFLSIFG